MLQVYPSNRSIHLLYPTHEGAPPLPNTALENTEKYDLQTNNCSWTSIGEVDPDRLLVEEEMTNKTTDKNESSIDNSSAQRNKQNIPLPPPSPPPEEDSNNESDTGHGSTHIPLYEGDKEPRQYWFIYESTWEENRVIDEDIQMA